MGTPAATGSRPDPGTVVVPVRGMQSPTAETLAKLCDAPGPWATVLSPLAGAGPEARADALRFDHLVDEVAEQLGSLERPGSDPSASRADDEAVLRGLRSAAEEPGTFAPATGSLLLFASPDGVHRWHVPGGRRELAAVGLRPTLLPVLPLVTEVEPFYLLALSLHGGRLVACDGVAERRVPLPASAPERIEDAAGYDVEDPHLQQHGLGRGVGAGPGGRTIVHGQGSGKDDRDVDLEKYLRALDAAVVEAIDDDLGDPNAHRPVVLACDPGVEGLYRRVSRLREIVEPAVHGNFEQTSDAELHRRAWPLIAPRAEARRARARQRFFDARGQGGTTTADRVDDIVPAAARGRVDTLLVREAAHVEGAFDPERWNVRIEDVAGPTEDLIERAAAETLRHGGSVFVLTADQMPAPTDLAAILRW